MFFFCFLLFCRRGIDTERGGGVVECDRVNKDGALGGAHVFILLYK